MRSNATFQATGTARRRLLVLVGQYPSISESFIRREIHELQANGFEIAVAVCGRLAGCDISMEDPVPVTVMRADPIGGRRFSVGLAAAPHALRYLPRTLPLFPRRSSGTRSALRAAWVAASLCPAVREWAPDWLHAHFLGLPAVVARLLSESLRIPWSVSAHARDIFVPALDPGRLTAGAQFISVCSEHGQASLIGRLPAAAARRVVLHRHSIECPPLASRRRPFGSPMRAISVCRLVPKKGIHVVLRSLALLPAEIAYRYKIIGDGPERASLEQLAKSLGLATVVFAGTVSPGQIGHELAATDVFLLGACTTPDGDRDGIPNAVLEAMASGVPVIAADGGSVSEVVRHGETGWLVPPNSPAALAEALREAAEDESLRRLVSTRAHRFVVEHFSLRPRPRDLSWRLKIGLDGHRRLSHS